MPMTYHMQLDIKGCLLNWGPRSHGGITDDDGRQMSNAEAKAALLDELAKGHRYLSFGGCPDFDPVKGCTGHPIELQGAAAAGGDAHSNANSGGSAMRQPPTHSEVLK